MCGEAQQAGPILAAKRGPSPRVRGSRTPRTIRYRTSRVHPRVCGEADIEDLTHGDKSGPSPRVRGSPYPRVTAPEVAGSIPACAGKPDRGCLRRSVPGVHPRVCGEAEIVRAPELPGRGPSPRVRGSPTPGRGSASSAGSIPACAGKPNARPRVRFQCRVHPRVCGEARRGSGARPWRSGPSPRVRGSPDPALQEAAPAGSIPACAGKPRRAGWRTPRGGVHPRVCGEAELDAGRAVPRPGPSPALCGEASRDWSAEAGGWGPSPRVRGSPCWARSSSGWSGSIPACAGKPRANAARNWKTKVHPRVCGEARPVTGAGVMGMGPSPRVRGSRTPRPPPRDRVGSIPACAGKPRALRGAGVQIGVHPACAGKPCRARSTWEATRVHPRVCGEACGTFSNKSPATGPSPRVRGSLEAIAEASGITGSIPACAGKPLILDALVAMLWVHPRVCGEAPRWAGRGCSCRGPSPRVRGSLGPVDLRLPRPGSIPACAGKPCGGPTRRGLLWVHPRVCGEARCTRVPRRIRPGPSPRVRGSPSPCAPAPLGRGSIPACAGKPTPRRWPRRRRRVHPRVCGEAALTAPPGDRGRGPSPRVRGSPLHPAPRDHLIGSIPACAGKPRSPSGSATGRWVHPRVCGEAAARWWSPGRGRGPSPRVRGSPARVGDSPSARGSIPACAGKPDEYCGDEQRPWVHPRVCGEARN